MQKRDRLIRFNLQKHGLLVLVGLGFILYWQKATEWYLLLQLKPIAIWLLSNLKTAIKTSMTEVIFNPIFYGMTAAILLLERLFPVEPKQKTFSIGLLQDSIWLLGSFVMRFCWIAPCTMGIDWLYTKLLGNWGINLPQLLALPDWLRFILSIIFADFVTWLSHLLMHQHSFLWRFHVIHHSQAQLNLFTSLRVHPGEMLLRYPILVLPWYLFAIPYPGQMYYIFFYNWYGRFCHSGIRCNMGWLKHIFVTPQYHRVHHSIELRQHNQNYGSLLTVWDFLFGTQHHNTQDYPETGIDDPQFPIAQKFTLPSVVRTYWAQILYPFH